MGYGEIQGGGPAGRYTLSLDYGEASRIANIAALEAQGSKLAADEQRAEEKFSASDSEYRTQRQGFIEALNTSIEMLNAAQALPSIAEINAQIQDIKNEANDQFNEASSIHTTKLIELSSANSALLSAKNQLREIQDEKDELLEVKQAAEIEQSEAAAARAIANEQLQTSQAIANSAEQAYADALVSGIDLDEKRLDMQNAQAALSNVIQLVELSIARLNAAQSELLEASAAYSEIEAEYYSKSDEVNDKQETADVALLAEQAALANKQVAQARLSRADETAAEIAAQNSSDVALSIAMQAVLAAKNQISNLDVSYGPSLAEMQRAVKAIKMARAQVTDMLARWNAAVVIETKPVWCVDYTEDGAGEVGTIDVNGETDITLIAPGCRQWRAGDGKVSTETKNAAIAKITAKQDQLSKRITDLNTQIDAETAKESILKAELDYAHIAYNTAPPELKQARANDVSIAAEKFQAQIAVVRRLKSRKVQTQSLQVEEARKLDAWNAKEASDSPVYGDGAMRHAITMSPEQSFLNRAIMPGWQRFMPTYRWGTITALDKDADTCSVSLASATSSQQSLNINQVSSLSNIPVVYMNCNAKAFEEGDEVVIEFESQDWSKPRVIGFLSGPKPCLQYTASYYAIGITSTNGGAVHLVGSLQRFKDEEWGTFTSTTPPAKHKFLGWNDDVTTLFRNDGIATSNISKTAQYTFAPDFELEYAWNIQAEPTSEPYWSGQQYLRDWQVRCFGDLLWREDALFGAIADTPAPQTFDAIIWSGVAEGGASGDDIVEFLTDPFYTLQIAAPPGPIYFPNYPTGTTATVTFKVAGVDNVYTVSGSATNNPAFGGRVPDTGNNTFEVIRFKFQATSWSATYG